MTPAGRHCLTYDEESWRPTPEDRPPAKDPSERGTLDVRQSKAKRVRNYLKKCKDALGRSSGGGPSWYLEERALRESEVVELEDVFEDAKEIEGIAEICEVANVVEVRGRPGSGGGVGDASSPTLTEAQSGAAGEGPAEELAEGEEGAEEKRKVSFCCGCWGGWKMAVEIDLKGLN